METVQIVNWLKDAERHETAEGLWFTGPCPMDYAANYRQMWNSPWVVSHPTAKHKLWRLIKFGYFGFNTKAGDPISIQVVEIET